MVALINAFLSYFVLFLIVVIAGGVAVFMGITLRKNKNKKEMSLAENSEN